MVNEDRTSFETSATEALGSCDHLEVELVEKGFFKHSEVMLLNVAGISFATVIIFGILLISHSGSIGFGKFLVLFPIAIFFVLKKVKENEKVKIVVCKKCGMKLDRN